MCFFFHWKADMRLLGNDVVVLVVRPSPNEFKVNNCTFLALKFLTNTHWLLTPYVFCVFLYILTVVVLPLCGIYWNATAIIFNFYFGKVGIVNAPSPSSI
eukprot:TRINITY_DN1003_c0_g1_i1.p2 TRINITY_DN1003_c0_g1~~TRINITY_DN1003_c0_g1_i1.p2  ORF type:complete len:100 (-),score=17.25 TRINITY_DN1003_c0_g1_i1:110-409(-)